MKKLLMMIMVGLLVASPAFAATFTQNPDTTYNICWNNVPQAKILRVFDGFEANYGNRYYNQSELDAGLTLAQKQNVWNSVTVGFWNEHTYVVEFEETLALAREAFDASYSAPIGE